MNDVNAISDLRKGSVLMDQRITQIVLELSSLQDGHRALHEQTTDDLATTALNYRELAGRVYKLELHDHVHPMNEGAPYDVEGRLKALESHCFPVKTLPEITEEDEKAYRQEVARLTAEAVIGEKYGNAYEQAKEILKDGIPVGDSEAAWDQEQKMIQSDAKWLRDIPHLAWWDHKDFKRLEDIAGRLDGIAEGKRYGGKQ